jgi:hypothetical protein
MIWLCLWPLIFGPATHPETKLNWPSLDGRVLDMNDQYAGSQEQLLVSLSIAAEDVRLATERLDSLTRDRRRLAEELMISSSIPLAELSRVAGIHRHTAASWKKALEDRDESEHPAFNPPVSRRLTLSSGVIQESSSRGIDTAE